MKKIFLMAIFLSQIYFNSQTLLVAQSYVPLNIGNVWVWESIEYNPYSSIRYKNIVIDTNFFLHNNYYYKILLNPNSTSDSIFAYARYNNSDSIYYTYSFSYNREIPYYKLNFALDDTLSYPISPNFNYTKTVVDIMQNLAFDSLVTIRRIHYNRGGLAQGHETWTDAFGMLTSKGSETSFDVAFRLRGCVINGRLYGDTSTVVSINENDIPPNKFHLYQNYPNPFNPSTIIEYEVDEYAFINLTVYDVLGNQIAVLVEGAKYPGKYSERFEGNSVAGGLASGIYFYRITVHSGNLSSERKMQTKKMFLLR